MYTVGTVHYCAVLPREHKDVLNCVEEMTRILEMERAMELVKAEGDGLAKPGEGGERDGKHGWTSSVEDCVWSGYPEGAIAMWVGGKNTGTRSCCTC